MGFVCEFVGVNCFFYSVFCSYGFLSLLEIIISYREDLLMIVGRVFSLLVIGRVIYGVNFLEVLELDRFGF